MSQDTGFLGLHLWPRGDSGNKEALDPACGLTTPCGRNIPFPFRSVPLKADLFAVHLLR